MGIVKKISVFAFMSVLLCGMTFAAAETDTKTENTNVAPAVSKSTKETQKKDLKTTPIKSFFARFSKKKDAKSLNNTQPEQPAVQKGGVVYTMDDCVKIALKNSPSVKNRQKTYEIQKSEVGVQKSNYFPTFSAGTGYGYSYTHLNDGLSQNNSAYTIDAGISALIWDFGRTAANINMSKYNRDAAFFELDFEKLSCVFNTKLAYTTVLAKRAETDVWAQNVQLNKLNLERTRAMYEVGMKSKIDVVNAESNYTEAKLGLLEAQNSYQNSLISLNHGMHYINQPAYSITSTETFKLNKEHNIKNEINIAFDSKNYSKEEYKAGLKDGSIFTGSVEKRTVADAYVLSPFALTMQEAVDAALKNRTDLKAMKLTESASKESLKAVKRSFYPALNASGRYGFTNDSEVQSNNVGFYAGVDLPQINAMALKNQIEQAKAYLDIAKNNVELLEAEIYFEVQALYVDMKQIEEKIPLMKQKVEFALENFELADGRYAVGMGNYIELQEALTDYNNAQLNFVNTVFLYNKARFSLEKAMNITQVY